MQQWNDLKCERINRYRREQSERARERSVLADCKGHWRTSTNMKYKHGEPAVFLPLALLFPLINVHKLIWLLSQYRKHPPERWPSVVSMPIQANKPRPKWVYQLKKLLSLNETSFLSQGWNDWIDSDNISFGHRRSSFRFTV